jgi:hypothetical protein
VTTSPDPLATRRAELNVLRELVDAAIAARPYVEHSQPGRYVEGLTERASHAGELLDRLDAAIADAGELLAEVSS